MRIRNEKPENDCLASLSGWLDDCLGFHQHIGLMAQGLQRGLDATKKVVAKKEPSSLLTVSQKFPPMHTETVTMHSKLLAASCQTCLSQS